MLLNYLFLVLFSLHFNEVLVLSFVTNSLKHLLIILLVLTLVN